ncbi:type IV pilus modification PilV family protein [Cysteiniphilum sp. 6C5]|uniref:type IV pilus modification PilV family protein n=1 Tax=unclassified Cysteiniphilum TaxID=2610889 RepID=UPI003F84DBBB
MVCNRKYKKYTKQIRNKRYYKSRKQAGFGLIESLIALTILVFVFTSFMAVMLRSATVASRTNNEVDIDILLDNRIERSWITGEAIELAPEGNIVFTQGTTQLTGRNTLLNVEQQRTYTVILDS